MRLTKNKNGQKLTPKNNYLSNLDETQLFEFVIGDEIDKTQYKDITDEEAEIIKNKIAKINEKSDNLNDAPKTFGKKCIVVK